MKTFRRMRYRQNTSSKGVMCFGFSLLFIASTTSAAAATLDDYRGRLERGRAAIQQLQTHEAEYQTGGERSADTVALVKAALPAHETVLLTGQTITVDNRWLHEALDKFGKANSESERKAQAAAINERLLAIVERIDELKQSAAAASKDESKARLAEILRRSEYNRTAAEGSALARLWAAFLRWLSNLFPETKPLQPGSARLASRIAQIVVVAISVGAIALLIWKFAPRYFRNRRKKKQKREARIVLGELLEPDQTSSDLLAQAEALARGGDLRAAIRKGYIALLCELGDRKIISLAQHKTNRDYLGAVRSQPPLFASMKTLTNSFELHWYGLAPAGEGDWTAFRNEYHRALTMGTRR